ncbi:MAG: TonB-dependent receptor [Owenweeksia sp.]|nr:TonB-dependent receptor [Owenweeksia sp.]
MKLDEPRPLVGVFYDLQSPMIKSYSMKLHLSLLFFLLATGLFAQEGIIKGRVYDAVNNEPLPYANVIVKGTDIGTTTDNEGNYELQVKPGLYNVEASFVGYKPQIEFEVQVTLAKPTFLNFGLDEASKTLDEVEVSAQNQFEKKEESPVSLNTLGINEIQRNPGGNQDISIVIQSLPGVASTPSFRNDIIIRGGGPNENKFFLDGIEIPSINHFATQGSSGGPVGLINVNFIKEVDLYTGAFPVNKAQALSSVMDLKLKDGRSDKLGYLSGRSI